MSALGSLCRGLAAFLLAAPGDTGAVPDSTGAAWQEAQDVVAQWVSEWVEAGAAPVDEPSDRDLSDRGLEDLLREAAAFRENPLDANSASLSDLLRVPFMDPGAALCVVSERAARGAFGDLDELLASGCLTGEALALVRPYISVKPPQASTGGLADRTAAALSHEGDPGARSSVLTRASIGASGDDDDHAWSPRTFTRVRLSAARLARGALDAGFGFERDPGEDSLLDHAAFRVEWRAAAGGLKLGAGDFALAWAQGLAAGSSGIATASSYPRARDRLRGYDGASEATARRGVYLCIPRGPVSAQVVLAGTRLDATVNEDGLVAALRRSGCHRTEGERAGADALEEKLAGARATLELVEGMRLGASVLRLEYDPPFAEGDPERQRFRFSGHALSLASVDALAQRGRWRAGVEVARSDRGGVAALASGSFPVGQARVAAGFAHVSRDYWSPLSGGAPVASGGTNGTGGWLRLEYRPAAGWRLWSEVLASRRPWRSYRDELPAGRERLALGCEVPLGTLGRATLSARESVGGCEDGAPAVTLAERSRVIRVDWSPSQDGGLEVSVIRATASAETIAASGPAGAPRGGLLVISTRTERPLGESGRLDAGLAVVSRRGDAPPVALYEPRLPGEFGLAPLNESGMRWYARLRSGLPFGLGLTARAAGGPGRGRLEFGVAVDTGG